MIYEITKGDIEKAFDCLEEVVRSFGAKIESGGLPLFLKKRIQVIIPDEVDKFAFLKKLYAKFRENGIEYTLSNTRDFMEEWDLVKGENHLKLIQNANKAIKGNG